MKRWMRLLVAAAALLISLLAVSAIYFLSAYPDVGPPPQLQVERTPSRIVRGAYLANHVTVCMDCHSTRDWSKFAAPIQKGTEGKGGDRFDEAVGVPGVIYALNITPFGISEMSDGELYRAITSGVTRGDRTIFPLMPYESYHSLADEDVYSLIAYLRQLPSIESQIPEPQVFFPAKYLIRLAPIRRMAVAFPDTTNIHEYGRYLVNAAACADCHTPRPDGIHPDPVMRFAGGREFQAPVGTIRSANLTPDAETGIGSWTEEDFLDRFRMYADTTWKTMEWRSVGYQTVMPWLMYAGMQEKDLRAIYAYLRTQQAIPHKVEHFTAR